MAKTKKAGPAAELEKLRRNAVKFIQAYDACNELPDDVGGFAIDQISDAVRDAAFDYIRAIACTVEE